MQREVVIETGTNHPPEKTINERLKKFGKEWRVVSSNTSLSPIFQQTQIPSAFPLSVIYTTTIVLEKTV